MKPDRKRRIPGAPMEWISHARSDLRLADLASGDEFVRKEQGCFHAQQAAEKAIKAVLLCRGIRFPLTHDIEELLEIAENAGIMLPDNVRETGQLTPYAVETRYPDYWYEVTADELNEAVRIAEVTVEGTADEVRRDSRTRP